MRRSTPFLSRFTRLSTRWLQLAVPIACVLAPAGGVSAATIFFSISGIGSGTLDAVDFTDQPYTISTTYDTADVEPFTTPDPSSGFSLVSNDATITIGGNLVTITDPVTLNVNNTSSAFTIGNDRVFQDLIILFGLPEFATYDLQSPLAPISVTDGFVQSTFAWRTDQGELFIDDDSAAALQMQITLIPEPSVLPLIALALAGTVLRRRRG